MTDFKSIVTSKDFQKLALSTFFRFFLIYMVIKFAFQGFSITNFKEEITTRPAEFLIFSVVISAIYGLVVAYIKIKKQQNEQV